MKLKRLFLVLLLSVVAFAFIGCKKEEKRTFASDGTFVAYEIAKASAPSISWVEVVIKNDAIDSVVVDCLQSTVTTVDGAGVFAFNAKSKQELGYGYHMHYYTYLATLEDATTATEDGYKQYMKDNNMLEWFEQANVMATEIKENYAAIATAETYTFTATSVSVSSAIYAKLAIEAVNNAINGKLTAFSVVDKTIVTATADIKENVVSNYEIDCLQGAMTSETVDDEVTYKFNMNEKSKRELGYGYHMHYYTYLATLEDATTATEDGYKQYMKDNNMLEWFEQADVLVSVFEQGVAINTNDDSKFTNTELSSVTISNSGYLEILNLIKSYAA